MPVWYSSRTPALLPPAPWTRAAAARNVPVARRRLRIQNKEAFGINPNNDVHVHMYSGEFGLGNAPLGIQVRSSGRAWPGRVQRVCVYRGSLCMYTLIRASKYKYGRFTCEGACTNACRYDNSKMAMILFAASLQRKYGSANFNAVSVNPGFVDSDIWRGFDRIPVVGTVFRFCTRALALTPAQVFLSQSDVTGICVDSPSTRPTSHHIRT